MNVTVDRFEGEFAVVETPDLQMCNIPRILCPNAKEGDVLSIKINSGETDKARERVKKLMDEVFC